MKTIYNCKKHYLSNIAGKAVIVCGFLLAVGLISYGLMSLGLLPHHLMWFCIIMYSIVAIGISFCLYVTASNNIVFCRAYRTGLSSKKIKKKFYLYSHGLIDVISYSFGGFLIGFMANFLDTNIIVICIATYLIIFSWLRYFLITKKIKNIEKTFPTSYKKTTRI